LTQDFTDARITISSNPVPANVCSSILDSLEADSSVTDESNPPSRKRLSPKVSINAEIAPDIRLVPENSLASIYSNIDTF
jgi:hypothetical protein